MSETSQTISKVVGYISLALFFFGSLVMFGIIHSIVGPTSQMILSAFMAVIFTMVVLITNSLTRIFVQLEQLADRTEDLADAFSGSED